MGEQQPDQKRDESLPKSKTVSDAIGLFGLALMTLGACTSLWRMLTGHDHSTPGQKIGLGLLTAGMLWLNWYLWRQPAKPIGYRPGDPIPPAPAELPSMEISYRGSRRLIQWVLAGVVAMSMLTAALVAFAYPFLKIAVWIGWIIGPLMIYALLSRRTERNHRGPVLCIDAGGITDLRAPQLGLVPWADIHHLEQSTLHSRRRLAVWLHPDSPSAVRFGWKRQVSRADAWLNGRAGDWFIDLESLDCRTEEVEKRAIQGLTAWRYSQQPPNDTPEP